MLNIKKNYTFKTYITSHGTEVFVWQNLTKVKVKIRSDKITLKLHTHVHQTLSTVE